MVVVNWIEHPSKSYLAEIDSAAPVWAFHFPIQKRARDLQDKKSILWIHIVMLKYHSNSQRLRISLFRRSYPGIYTWGELFSPFCDSEVWLGSFWFISKLPRTHIVIIIINISDHRWTAREKLLERSVFHTFACFLKKWISKSNIERNYTRGKR